MHSHFLLGLSLTLLCDTAQMLTEPGLGWPTCTAYILWASQRSTDPVCLEHVSSEAASMPCGVTGVSAHTAVC